MTIVFGMESQKCLQGDFITPKQCDFSTEQLFLFYVLENWKKDAVTAVVPWDMELDNACCVEFTEKLELVVFESKIEEYLSLISYIRCPLNTTCLSMSVCPSNKSQKVTVSLGECINGTKFFLKTNRNIFCEF